MHQTDHQENRKISNVLDNLTGQQAKEHGAKTTNTSCQTRNRTNHLVGE